MYKIKEIKSPLSKFQGDNMLSHDEQLNKLLNLGLKIHPLNDNNCWGIFASTTEKAIIRFEMIQSIFPQTTVKKLNNNLEGDFGVNLYGKL